MPGNFIHFSVYLNPQRDRELIDWLRRQRNVSFAIREVLWRHLSSQAAPSPGAVQVDIRPETLQEAVEAGIDARLSAIRQVVEASLVEVLSTLSLSTTTPSGVDGDEETEALVDRLNNNLLLE